MQCHMPATNTRISSRWRRTPTTAVLALGQVAAKAGIDKQLLELIKLRASQINGCAFCVQYHILQGEKLGMPADKLNLVVVWREAPQFSAARTRGTGLDGSADPAQRRRQRRGLCGGERGVFREGAGLSDVGGRLDQCLEQVRRRLSLDAAGAEESGRRGGFVRTSIAARSPAWRLPKSGLAMQRSGGAAPLLPADLRSPYDPRRGVAAGIAGIAHQTAHKGPPGRRQAVDHRVRQSATRCATPCLPGSCRSRLRRCERPLRTDTESEGRTRGDAFEPHRESSHLAFPEPFIIRRGFVRPT